MQFRKIFIIGCILAVLIIIIYTISTYKIIKNSRQVYYQGNKILCVTYKEPLISFGSGHKVLRLYTRNYLLLGKVTFGEHPLIIEKLEGKNIFLKIESKYRENEDYIKYVSSWVKKNKKIGAYNLHYKIITLDKEIEF